uniref:Uncharacterized protein LOC108041437 n=1 Tax=Drosophila rhopaloa TaxID=1041015 RepID=A0A6P4EEA8_DRORH
MIYPKFKGHKTRASRRGKRIKVVSMPLGNRAIQATEKTENHHRHHLMIFGGPRTLWRSFGVGSYLWA